MPTVSIAQEVRGLEILYHHRKVQVTLFGKRRQQAPCASSIGSHDVSTLHKVAACLGGKVTKKVRLGFGRLMKAVSQVVWGPAAEAMMVGLPPRPPCWYAEIVRQV
jgi:hypothetical protein